MQDLSLHLLDIAGNATAAGASRVEISVVEDPEADRLVLEVRDDGPGMDSEALARARDPFGTTRAGRRVGLGIPLLEQAAEEAGGGLEIDSHPGTGTLVRATFRASHINRKPLGDLAATAEALVAGNPDTIFEINIRLGSRHAAVNTGHLRDEVGCAPPRAAFMAALRERLAAVRATAPASGKVTPR